MQHLNLPSRIVMFSICSSIEYDIKKHTYAAVNIPQYAGGLNHPSIFLLF